MLSQKNLYVAINLHIPLTSLTLYNHYTTHISAVYVGIYLGYSPITFALTMCISHFTLLHPLLCVYVSRKQGPEIPFGFPRNITTSCQGLVALCVMAPFSKVPWNTLMEQISKVRALGIHICWLDMAGVGVFLSKEVKVLWLTHI